MSDYLAEKELRRKRLLRTKPWPVRAFLFCRRVLFALIVAALVLYFLALLTYFALVNALA